MAARADRQREPSIGSCWKRTPTPTVSGVIAWMHTFSPAKMWIRGLDALQKPLLHLHTQANAALPWSEIDMDFMNLNQAAHGDREFGYIQTRLGVARKTVVGHVCDPSVTARIGAWQRAARGSRRAAPAEAGPVRRQHARRRGHRGRQGRGRAPLRGLGQHLRRQRSCRRGRRRRPTPRSTTWCTSTATSTTSPPSCGPAASGTSRCATAPGSRSGCATSSPMVASAPSPRTSRTSVGCGSCPGLAVQRLMADGYGFGGEGDWKTSVMLHTIKAMAAGQPGGTSFMEDYTYDLHRGTRARSSAPTCSRSARRSPATARPWRSTRSASATARTRSGWCSPPHPARRRARHLRPRRPVPAGRQRGRRRRARRAPAQAPGRPRGLGAAARLRHLGRVLAPGRRPAPHRPLHRRRHRGVPRPRDDASTELVVIDDSTSIRPSRTSCGGARPTTASPHACSTRCPTTRWRWWTKIASVTGPNRGRVPR